MKQAFRLQPRTALIQNQSSMTAVHRDVVIFFTYRTLFESSDLDTVNYNGWEEALESFGYQNMSRFTFLKELALATPREVMQALCPYTTQTEWAPALNKRAVRLARDFKELIPPELLPLQGIKEFLISCAREPTVKLTTVLLSPFDEPLTKTLLERAEFGAFVDLVHCYQEREHAILEALEKMNIMPPLIPADVTTLWEQPGTEAAIRNAELIAFEADPIGVRSALALGIQTVGISFNAFDDGATHLEHEDVGQDVAEDGGSGAGVAGDAALLEAGASCVLRDFAGLRYEYLKHMQPSQP